MRRFRRDDGRMAMLVRMRPGRQRRRKKAEHQHDGQETRNSTRGPRGYMRDRTHTALISYRARAGHRAEGRTHATLRGRSRTQSGAARENDKGPTMTRCQNRCEMPA